jgi:hypothetical protein
VRWVAPGPGILKPDSFSVGEGPTFGGDMEGCWEGRVGSGERLIKSLVVENLPESDVYLCMSMGRNGESLAAHHLSRELLGGCIPFS